MPTSSISEDCAVAIQTAVRALNLSTITDAEVQIRNEPFTDSEIHRGVSITPVDATFVPGVQGADDIGYGWQITWIRGRQNKFNESPVAIVRDWHAISRAFHDRRLTDVLTNTICHVSTVRLILPKAHRRDYLGSAIVVRCWSREIRS